MSAAAAPGPAPARAAAAAGGPAPGAPAPGAGTIVIDVQGLTKRFGARTVVDALTMRVRRGEIFGFLGPNGSGKTTSIRMMCGLLTPDAGSGRTLGHDVVDEAAAIKRKVGYMTQRFGLYEDMTLRENLDFIARVYGMARRRARVDAALERLGLTARQRQLAGNLSGGWKQRLALAASMLHEPQLLLLDEPTAGVDPQARREFWEEIQALAADGITALVSTHYMDEAERCHRLGYIAEGRLLATGTPDELIRGSGLSSWIVQTGDPGAIGTELEHAAGVEMVTRFGGAVRVSGTDAQSLAATLEPLADRPGVRLTKGRPELEDVFVHLMRAARTSHATA